MSSLGKETTVTVNGKAWTFGRIKLSVIVEFCDWVREREGNPFEQLKEFVQYLAQADIPVLFREAQTRWSDLNSLHLKHPIMMKYQQSPEGAGRMAMLMLRHHHPDITPDEAFDITQQIGSVKMEQIMRDAFGESALKNGDGAGDRPKMKSGSTSG